MSSEIEITEVQGVARLDECADQASMKLMIVPGNVESNDEPLFASTLPTIVKLAKQQNLPLGVYGTGLPKLLEQRSVDWFAPALFVSSLLYTQNPHALSIALSMISNYLTSMFPGAGNTPNVRLNVYYQNRESKVTKKLSYRGPVGGLSKIEGAVEAIARGNKP